jgi:hypothetical protein
MDHDSSINRERVVTAAIGFCGLGMWQDAWNELETLEPEDRAQPEVLGIRLGILLALGRYESAAILAEGMIARGDTSPHTWLQGAVAIRSHRSIAEAREFLLRAAPLLEENATFQYTLASFECQLGNMPLRPGHPFATVELEGEIRALNRLEVMRRSY